MRIFIALALVVATPATAQTAPDLAMLRAGMAGKWEGTLEYRDYQSDRWFGIPFTTSIEALEDRATLIRRSLFDDGPGNRVWITTVALLDPATGTETAGTFRAGRKPELTTSTLRITEARDAKHWTILDESDGSDDDRPAHIRETIKRDGDVVTTLKEVDFSDDSGETWIVRNRTTLKRLGD